MERFVCESEDPGDVYLAGCCLFALFARCRWSDLRYLDDLTEDRTDNSGEVFGFLESSTAMHKTSASADRKLRPNCCAFVGCHRLGLDEAMAQ